AEGPVYRYADPEAGLLDGGLFLFSYGMNPKVVLLLELRREGDAAPAWQYGLARLAATDLTVRLGERAVWEQPAAEGRTQQDPFYAHLVPAARPLNAQSLAVHGHTGQVWFAAYSPDGQTLATGGDDKRVRLHRSASALARPSFAARTTYVVCVAYSPDGKRV